MFCKQEIVNLQKNKKLFVQYENIFSLHYMQCLFNTLLMNNVIQIGSNINETLHHSINYNVYPIQVCSLDFYWMLFYSNFFRTNRMCLNRFKKKTSIISKFTC